MLDYPFKLKTRTTEAASDPEEGAACLHGGVREDGGGAEEELRGVPRQVPLPRLPGATGSCPTPHKVVISCPVLLGVEL